MMRKIRTITKLFGYLALLAFATGCASTMPKPQFSKEIAPECRVTAQDTAQVHVVADNDVTMLDIEKARLSEKVKIKVDEFKVKNTKENVPAKSYQVDLLITRYEKGNAFARAMLAGLGQIHIDGEVAVYEIPDKTLVGQFTISKTFAWGGIYGASTSIEDIELTFAEGVAAALTGHVAKKNTQDTSQLYHK